MTGTWDIMVGPCHGCATVFAFDPATVASVPAGGQQEPAGAQPDDQQRPVCDPCADRAEAVVRTFGLFPLWPVRQAQQVGQRPQ